ncbi:MAG: HPr family phosphocarrier protein [bacterium]|nr:HPr family phosphocarrier protein [bacterium]
MVQREIVIKMKEGLHAKPVADFVNHAQKFKSDIKIVKDGETVNGKSILNMLTLGAKYNTKLMLMIKGKDEVKALDVLSKLLLEGE